jgi:hypothetical protein
MNEDLCSRQLLVEEGLDDVLRERSKLRLLERGGPRVVPFQCGGRRHLLDQTARSLDDAVSHVQVRIIRRGACVPRVDHHPRERAQAGERRAELMSGEC